MCVCELPIVLETHNRYTIHEHIYAYEGAGKHLYDSGIIFADYLNGQKARIKLIAAIGSDYTIEEMKKSFEWA